MRVNGIAVSDAIIMEDISQEVILGREVETQSKETSQVVVIWRVFFFFFQKAQEVSTKILKHTCA